MLKRFLGCGVLCLSLVACSAPAPFAQAVPSTPVGDLPVALQQGVRLAQVPSPIPQIIIDAADAEYQLLTNIYARSAPSVVNVEASVLASPIITSATPETNRGSGFVYDTQGHIVTNAHVVLGATSLRVTFQDGYVVEAQLVGADSYSDVALLRVNTAPERLLALPLADSDLVRVGQRAIAIGNPFGLSSSMSVGIVSGIGRTLRSAELMDSTALAGYQNPAIIQMDAPINPGNSGGPVLNSQGEVMGIASAIRSESGVFEGVGFAVPANTLKRVVPELLARGRVAYAWLGISVTPEEGGFGVASLAQDLGLPVTAGILVRGVTVGSPADVAGIRGGDEVVNVRGQSVCKGGDIIVAINERYVSKMDDLVAYLLAQTRPEQTVMLRVIRDGQSFDVPVVLKERPTEGGELRDCRR